LRIVGAKITQEVTETMCAGKGAPYHEFFVKWKK